MFSKIPKRYFYSILVIAILISTPIWFKLVFVFHLERLSLKKQIIIGNQFVCDMLITRFQSSNETQKTNLKKEMLSFLAINNDEFTVDYNLYSGHRKLISLIFDSEAGYAGIEKVERCTYNVLSLFQNEFDAILPEVFNSNLLKSAFASEHSQNFKSFLKEVCTNNPKCVEPIYQQLIKTTVLQKK
jgi:hypothetical protein